MQIKTESGKDSFEWLLVAKGMAILLVVVGHFRPESSPTYWLTMRSVVYSFHMPLFFILSGYLYCHGKYSYNSLIRKKVKRLLYPFITIAVSFFLIKYVAGLVVHLDRPVNIANIYALVTDPVNSYVPILWFIQSLFLIFATYPLARLFLNNASMLLLLVVLNVVIGSDHIVFGNALANMPFFVVGVFLRENAKLSSMTMGANWLYAAVSLVVFVLLYCLQNSVSIMSVAGYPVILSIGVIGSLLLINISHAICSLPNGRIRAALLQIGFYSMSIYLFHTLFESTIRIGFLQVFKHIEIPFELIAAIAITCGVVFPLVFEKEILRKYSVTKKFILGLP